IEPPSESPKPRKGTAQVLSQNLVRMVAQVLVAQVPVAQVLVAQVLVAQVPVAQVLVARLLVSLPDRLTQCLADLDQVGPLPLPRDQGRLGSAQGLTGKTNHPADEFFYPCAGGGRDQKPIGEPIGPWGHFP